MSSSEDDDDAVGQVQQFLAGVKLQHRQQKVEYNAINNTDHGTATVQRTLQERLYSGMVVQKPTKKQRQDMEEERAILGCNVEITYGEHLGIKYKVKSIQGSYFGLENSNLPLQRYSNLSVLLNNKGQKLKALQDNNGTCRVWAFHNSEEDIVYDNSGEEKKQVYATVAGLDDYVDGLPDLYARKGLLYIGKHQEEEGNNYKEIAEAYMTSQEFRNWMNVNYISKKRWVPYEDLKNHLDSVGAAVYNLNSDGLCGDKHAQSLEAKEFRAEMVASRTGDYIADNLSLGNLCDVESSEAARVDYIFERLNDPPPFTTNDAAANDDEHTTRWATLTNFYVESAQLSPSLVALRSGADKKKYSHFFHVASHGDDPWGSTSYPRPGSLTPAASAAPVTTHQHMYLDKANYVTWAQNTNYPGMIPPISYYNRCEALYGGPNRHFEQLGLGFNDMDGYLDFCVKNGVCLQGSWQIEDQDPDKRQMNDMAWRVEHSPHIREESRPAHNHHCYVGADLALRLLGHRYKPDRTFVYGPGKSRGREAYVYVVDGRFKPLLDRVGLGMGNTPDLARCPLPLPVAAVYKVTWAGPGLAGAVFKQVF